MVRPRSSPFYWMSRRRNSFHGSFSTRFDCSGARTRFTSFLSAIYAPFCILGRWRPGVCYDVKAVKSQILYQGRAFLRHVIPAVVKPAHALWNEVIGFLFLCLAVIFGFNGVRAYLADEPARLFLAAPLTLIMGWYGVSSFRKARKISRS